MTWTPDILEGYERRAIEVPADSASADEPEGALEATLIRRVPLNHRRAVLYMHGFNDYFFQTHLADFFAEHGFDFYALDLRRCGRSLRPGQLPSYIANLEEYFHELDAALAVIKDEGHGSVSVVGHSTGGLIACLWADQRPGVLDAVVLNSPWLELQGATPVTALVRPVVKAAAERAPTAVIPLPDDAQLSAKNMHVSFGGEWDYDFSMKRAEAVPIRTGWARAILQGQRRVADGLAIDAPVLVLTSHKTKFRRRWHPDLRKVDVVVDVSQIHKRATKLGKRVSMVKITDGMHDLTLSVPAAREEFFGALSEWLREHVPHEAPADTAAE